MDALWRLLWALPLVLAMALAAAFVLRRFVGTQRPGSRAAQRVSSRESLALSDSTRVHLIEVDGAGYLVVESSQHATLQPLEAAGVRRSHAAHGSAWLRRLQETRAR
jgi:flagellar biogenesis protein FliO